MTKRERRQVIALMAGLALLSAAAALLVHAAQLQAWLVAGFSFGAVVAAALLISWGAEAAQFFVSQGLAVAFIALLQVVPEFMVEAVIAWQAGQTGHTGLVFANATGSNRLLTGFGWPLIFFVTDLFHRRKHGKPLQAIQLAPEHVIEVLALLAASCWYLVVIAKGTLSLVDSTALGLAFAFYLWTLNRLPAEEEEEVEELLAPPRVLVGLSRRRWRNFWIGSIFALGGIVMWAVAEPFLGSMKELAFALGVSQFAFVQWVAPFLTEFPEKVTAVYWSSRVKLAPMALLNMVSSTVNQFTALVAMIPIAYSMSLGGSAAIPMDPLHKVEIFLSFATTLYGVACLAKLRFTRGNALVMLALFLVQFFYQGPIDVPVLRHGALVLAPEHAHFVVAVAYLAMALAEVVARRREIHLVSALRASVAAMRSK